LMSNYKIQTNLLAALQLHSLPNTQLIRTMTRN